jgi:lipoate-protein ligase A
MMPTLDLIVQPVIAPAYSLAADRHFLHAMAHPSRTRLGVLRVYDFTGDVLSLGRYHLVPAPMVPAPTAVSLHRRFSGGRAVPFGDGFVGVALFLPHRSALYGDDPLTLAPYQVPNRYVRGVLEACRLAGLAVFYPGRDVITVNRRVLGMVSFEVERSGAMLFEAVLAVRRDFSLLPRLLEQADPAGVIKAEMLTPDHTTCLERELHISLTTEEVARLIRRGYETQFNLRLEARALSPLEERALDATAAREFHDDRWLRQRRLRPELDRHAWTRVQLGVFEAYLGLEQGRFLREVTFGGDFIANSPAIERLEHDLRLCPAEWRSIDAVVSDVFAQPDNYILGIGHARTVTDTICKAIEA